MYMLVMVLSGSMRDIILDHADFLIFQHFYMGFSNFNLLNMSGFYCLEEDFYNSITHSNKNKIHQLADESLDTLHGIDSIGSLDKSNIIYDGNIIIFNEKFCVNIGTQPENEDEDERLNMPISRRILY
ncbi:uncharacterized protein RJT21DRAFT_111437 [Scheffersomyces amazonensis]|uniref:uncharacterized protein n=1 Tax=Scheffersomyces amazonensis TaxID=1078765 RepID=UPI00315DCFAE